MRIRTFATILLALTLLTVGLWLRAQYSSHFATRLRSTVEANLLAEISIIDKQGANLMLNPSPSSTAWDEVDHMFILVDSSGIVAWSGNPIVHDPRENTGNEGINFVSNQRGQFLTKKWPADTGQLICMLPLKDRYPITNNFLAPKLNPKIFPVRELEVVSPSGTVGEAVSVNGKVVFRIVMGQSETRDSNLSFAVLVAGLCLLLYGLFRLSRSLEAKYGYDLNLIGLLLGLYGIRLLMVQIGLPALFLQADIFDPKRFASSPLNASMGDLLLNGICVMLVVVYVFRNFSKMVWVRWLLQRRGYLRFMAGVGCLLLSFFALLFSYNFIEVVYHNSVQSLDITQSLSFDWVRIVAFMAVLSGTISALMVIHMNVSLARHLVPEGLISFMTALLLAAALFYGQYSLSGGNNYITLLIGLLLFILLRILKFDRLELRFSFRFFMYVIFLLITFSIHHSLAIRLFHEERQVRDQFRFAKDFLTERDVLGEYLLNQARQRIGDDQFIKARMASPLFTNASVIDKIKRVHLNSYFDRYELSIVTRKPGDSLWNQLGVDSSVFQATGYDGISFAGTATGNAVKQYRVSIPVYLQRLVGVLELELVLKRVVPDNVFPELLVDNRFSQIYRNRDFSYAVFKGSSLVSSFGSYNYERDFPKSKLEDTDLYRNGITDSPYFHVGIEETAGSYAVVSAMTYSWSSLVTNVSVWFVVGLTLMLTTQGLFGIYSWYMGRQFGYTVRIQLFMFLAFALPVVAVSVTTLTLLGSSSEEATKQEFLDRSVTTSQQVAELFSSNATAVEAALEAWIVENAAFSKSDISVYSPAGKLVATSQPALFENQLLSTRMNREALRRIVLEEEMQTVTSEYIGTLQYSCAYAAVLSPQSGLLIAVVSLPFFESATFLQKEQILILSSILKVFVVVFLVFSLLSFWAASNLALPIRFIAKTLRHTSFTGENKPLNWNASDEIGMLAKEYNRMVENLENSKRALALSEKESAWREMAKQVAHEIKNPLTPMKLTLQQMDQGLQSGNLQPEKAQKSVDVLLKQVEILNTIAASFSTFASMPAPAPQRVELNSLLSDAVSLFESGGDAAISFAPSPDSPNISADPPSLTRAFSNIVINAIQAKRDHQPIAIHVTCTVNGNRVLISIQDNGRGIAKDVQDKVFQPQFTTKESGSGLGLALTRQVILQAGGRIWFDSVPDEGATFYVELPLLD